MTPTVVATVDRAGTVPVAPNPSPSSVGLTLTVSPDHGVVGSGVQIEGSIAPDLRSSTEIWVEFWPDGPHQSLGDKAHTKYTGPVWPSRWPVRPGPDGHFTLDVVKVPRVIQTASGDLWLIEPGAHDFALVLDSQHTVFAPFRVDAPPPPPTALPPPTVRFDHLWLADARTGWLTGARCQESLPPTPDANGNVPGPAPPQCEGLIERTTDAGQTWQEQYRGKILVEQIQFVDERTGWAIGRQNGDCSHTLCPAVLLRTGDAGAHWNPVFSTALDLPSIAFTSPTEGWVLGRACTFAVTATECVPRLLITHDGGRTWRGQPAPVIGSVSHPTARDGWIAASFSVPGTPQLVVTHDGGQTWQTLAQPEGDVKSIFFRTLLEGWLLAGTQPGAGSQPKAVYHTTDGGRTWVRLAASREWDQTVGQDGGITDSGYLGPMVFTTPRDGWIASARGGLLHSADGGKTWTPAPIDAHYFVDVHFADPRDGWALSIEDPGLWATSDGGKTWRSIALPSGGAR